MNEYPIGYKYKTLEKMKYGFIDFNSNEWCNLWVDCYNRQIERCNAYLSNGREVPENVLNGKHNVFIATVNAAKWKV